ncbi:hypothetical protein BHE74_00058115 [Ensete ventricosum]|nr:hypothetical protein GW17_00049846 [Ensete ventricosum]RWW36823.1 hypothetical protein BHE74_00058115 [Ensete ventricosum]RZR87692.1 hypothetical protein BHM03_00015147 [Ensete ventricosum]
MRGQGRHGERRYFFLLLLFFFLLFLFYFFPFSPSINRRQLISPSIDRRRSKSTIDGRNRPPMVDFGGTTR